MSPDAFAVYDSARPVVGAAKPCETGLTLVDRYLDANKAYTEKGTGVTEKLTAGNCFRFESVCTTV